MTDPWLLETQLVPSNEYTAYVFEDRAEAPLSLHELLTAEIVQTPCAGLGLTRSTR